MNNLRSIFNQINEELKFATNKFPTWPDDIIHAAMVVAEESGELMKESLQLVYEPHKTNLQKVEKEAIQTAVTAIRFLLSMTEYKTIPSFQHKQSEENNE